MEIQNIKMPVLVFAGIVMIAYLFGVALPGLSHGADSQQSRNLPVLAPSSAEAANSITQNVTIFVYEQDFSISPAVVNAIQGENVTLIITNRGTIDYGLNISGNGVMLGIGKDIMPGREATLKFRAPQAGNYTIYSPIPGQRDLGLNASLVVRA